MWLRWGGGVIYTKCQNKWLLTPESYLLESTIITSNTPLLILLLKYYIIAIAFLTLTLHTPSSPTQDLSKTKPISIIHKGIFLNF